LTEPFIAEIRSGMKCPSRSHCLQSFQAQNGSQMAFLAVLQAD
jgi:hypothetical protein